MKILHTADWHIGKKLHQFDLKEDINLFISWLIELIQQEQITILLISGDVFDLGNPSSEARKQYYQSILKLQQLNCTIIITGGNHDSSNMLNAPKDLLNQLNIHVIGGMPNSIDELIIPIEKEGKVELLIAAVPYLREGDLRRANEGNSYEDRLQIVQKGIENTYQSIYELCHSKYPDVPVIAMGHLYTAGATTSESERDIQVGYQAMFHASKFGDNFSYIALGHIHKPQKVHIVTPTYYSGSPYPLSFSEKDDTKRVLLIDTNNGFEPKSINVPKFRELIKIKGSLHEIKYKLEKIENQSILKSLIEIELVEDVYNEDSISKLEELIKDFEKDGLEIIHRTIHFRQKVSGTDQLYNHNQALSELSPREVFIKKMDSQDINQETKDNLLEVFQLLLEEVEQENS